jgi:hypothetical protein
MLLRGKTLFRFENVKKGSNTSLGQNVEILDVNTCGTYGNHCSLVKGLEQFQTSLYVCIKYKGLTRRLS